MNEKAPDGQIWICVYDNKLAIWKYGFDDAGKGCSSFGYDESCMMNASLVSLRDLSGHLREDAEKMRKTYA